ncbi:hypothetical protein FQR65_LT04290 [Abscondita terminalis]|nr:hypothetical protein FQR65_LT04290 [Abscondita terminalis]
MKDCSTAITIDQAHEQHNALVKEDGGTPVQRLADLSKNSNVTYKNQNTPFTVSNIYHSKEEDTLRSIDKELLRDWKHI